jgi:hypothetical protein
LQLFWPLHALVAVLQALVPLQELIPEHFTSATFLAAPEVLPPPDEHPAINKVAAAEAKAIPVIFDTVFIFISFNSNVTT